MEYQVSLSDRNKKVYNLVEECYQEKDSIAIVQPTGTGKSFIAMELLARNKDKNILYLAPTLAILKQFKRHMLEEGLLGDNKNLSEEEIDEQIHKYYPNLELKTYHWFHKQQTEGKLDDKHYDYLICDEYHHTGGDKWYISFNEFKQKHKETKYFGMSATPQRLDGCSTLFSFDEDVVYYYSLAEAIVNGELPIPIYIDCGIRYLKEIEEARETIIEEFREGKEKNRLLEDIDKFIKRINSYENLPEILARYVGKNSKVLYFCPPSDEEDRRNKTKRIYDIYKLKEKMFSKVNEKAHFYMSFGEYNESDSDEEAFLKDNEEILRVLYTVNKYNEGVHIEDIDTLILGRGTTSVSLFYQMIGRGLSAGKNKNIQPIIIDLAGNIHIYQEIVEEVRKVANEKAKREKRLPNNEVLDVFMTRFKIYDYELEEEEFIKSIKENIRDNRTKLYATSVLEKVRQIQEYCETYEEWPKYYQNPQTEQEKLSYKLYNWLKSSNYNKEGKKFKYRDIVDENGIRIQTILDDLYKKYAKSIQGSKPYVIEMVRQTKEYCETYGEWPKKYKNSQTEQENLSNKLFYWLSTSNFYKEDQEFKYRNILDENGISVEEILDDLYKKYARLIPGSKEYVLEMVRQTKEYCETYGEWPKSYNNPQTEHENLSRKLYSWLKTSNYNKEGQEFKYHNILDENGISLEEILDDLYKKYARLIPGSKEYVLEMVKQIKEYCETYEEWPKQYRNYQTEHEKLSRKLHIWLDYFNYNKEDKKFKYRDILDENGISVEEILDDLYKKYARLIPGSKEYVLEMVRQIRVYCETYGEWPKSYNNPKTEQEILSRKLHSWLDNSNYSKEDKKFKYGDVVDDNEISIEEILYDLYKKYARLIPGSKEYAIEMVRQIKVYCETYEEWPKNYRKPQTEQEILSRKLNKWLRTSNYNKEDKQFKYRDMLDKNGISIEKILDNLYKKYASLIPGSIPYAKEMIRQIKEYCETYREWPKSYNNPQTEQENLSRKLYSWLKTSNYNTEDQEFKYNNILDDNGINIKEILNGLYIKYGKASIRSKAHVIEMVRQTKEYCETYGEWPRRYKNSQTEQEKLSNKLFCWLSASNFYKEDQEFKYGDVVDENGILVQEILDDLYKKYAKSIQGSSPYTIEMIRQIKEYCETYGEWPKSYKKTQTEQEKLSNKLFYWLAASNFYKEDQEFKYRDIIDENGTSVEEILDNYYAIYAKKKLAQVSSEKQILNIWQAKDSKSISLSIYYLVYEYDRAYQENNQEMCSYYKDVIEMKLKNNNLYINMNEFMEMIENHDINKMWEYYTFYSLANQNELALLFKNLHQYFLINTENRTR